MVAADERAPARRASWEIATALSRAVRLPRARPRVRDLPGPRRRLAPWPPAGVAAPRARCGRCSRPWPWPPGSRGASARAVIPAGSVAAAARGLRRALPGRPRQAEPPHHADAHHAHRGSTPPWGSSSGPSSCSAVVATARSLRRHRSTPGTATETEAARERRRGAQPRAPRLRWRSLAGGVPRAAARDRLVRVRRRPARPAAAPPRAHGRPPPRARPRAARRASSGARPSPPARWSSSRSSRRSVFQARGERLARGPRRRAGGRPAAEPAARSEQRRLHGAPLRPLRQARSGRPARRRQRHLVSPGLGASIRRPTTPRSACPTRYSESDLRVDRLARVPPRRTGTTCSFERGPTAAEPQRAAGARARDPPGRLVALSERSAGAGSARALAYGPQCV